MINDETLLELITVGNTKAFEQLIRKYYPTLLRFASDILRDNHSAEDVVQEVFIRLWEQRANSGKIESIRSYLYVSVRNSALNLIRSEERLRERHERMLTEEYFRLQIVEEETLRQLSEIIETLPTRSATVLKLTAQGLSLKEIADEMQISINTVKSTKAYAINKIRKQFGAIFLLMYICGQQPCSFVCNSEQEHFIQKDLKDKQ